MNKRLWLFIPPSLIEPSELAAFPPANLIAALWV